MPRKYPAGHYESSACNGLGRAGNVCPGMLLPCMILKDTMAFEPSQLLPTVNCSVMPLLGLGFNPSIVPIDASLLPAGLNLLRPPAYLAADRYHRVNMMVPCRNRNVHRKVDNLPESSGSPVGETRLSLLDRDFRILCRSLVRSEGCIRGANRICDGRLLRLENSSAIFLAYANYWPSHCQKRLGYFLTPLNLTRPTKPWITRRTAEREMDGRGEHNVTFEVRMRHTNRNATGRTDSGMHQLKAPRNGGVLLLRNGTAVELVDIAPKTTFWSVPLSPQELETGDMDNRLDQMRQPIMLRQRRAPRSFSAEVHNSIHPIWVEEYNAYLAVGHIHYLPRADEKGPYEFGSSYRQIFFTIDETKLSIRRFSRELCFPSLESRGKDNARIVTERHAVCDGVQFVMGGFRQGPSFHFSYGVNDCESALLTLSLSRIDKLLEFSNDNENVRDHRSARRSTSAARPPAARQSETDEQDSPDE